MIKKIIHTSDWHLGKKLYQEDRTNEHQAYLEWLLNYAAQNEVDVLIMSGDLYDSPNPPHIAQRAYYDFLARWFEHSPKREAYILGGNHDSGPLINAPSSLLESALKGERLKLIGSFEPSRWEDFVIKTEWATICALPYFRLHEILNLTKKFSTDSSTPEDDQTESIKLLNTLETLFSRWREQSDQNKVKILMGHHVFGPYMASGSELGVPLSGLETIPLGVLGAWDYVALGHIHKPQVMNFEGTPVVYSGSPLRMRFSEHEKKKISLIKIDTQNQKLDYELIDIPAFRKLYRLKANKQNIEAKVNEIIKEEQSKKTTLTSFIEAELECDSPWIGAADEIRSLLEAGLDVGEDQMPRLLSAHHRVMGQISEEIAPVRKSQLFNLGSLNLTELFEKYYSEKYPESSQVPIEIKDLFHELLKEQGESDVH